MKRNSYATFAIIVTYNPDNVILDVFISMITLQVTKVIIIDNSENSLINNYEDVEIIRLGDNIGIAAAQNIGVQKAISEGGDFIFTFDQDSLISESYCFDMVEEYISNKDKYSIACLGPSINEMTNKSISNPLVEKDFVISSGALFPKHAFVEVGMFKAEWFIDMIDVEWSYRARTIGMRTFETLNVVMRHNIGENDYPKIFNREVRIGSPVRQYYLVRNWIFSLKCNSFNTKYKFYIIILLLKKVPLFCMLSPRRQRMKFIMNGIWDGIIGRGGKCSSR